MIRKVRFLKIFIAFTIAIAMIVSGCSFSQNTTPSSTSETETSNIVKVTATPTPERAQNTKYGPLCRVSLSFIRFPDGSELYLAPETEIEILSIEDLSTGILGYEVLLSRGQLVFLPQPPQEVQFTVISPEGYIAQLTGSIMFVGIEKDLGRFTAICVDGVCSLGSDLQSLIPLAAESEGWLDENGNFQGPFEIDINALREGCGEDYISVVIPPTATPDIGATATAFCGDFEEENPGTPCP